MNYRPAQARASRSIRQDLTDSLQLFRVKNMTQMTPSRKPIDTILFIILGIVFWLEALLCIRFAGET